jgi:hypothetical protein
MAMFLVKTSRYDNTILLALDASDDSR